MELSLKNPECTNILVYSNYSHTTSTITTVGEDELPLTNAWSFLGTLLSLGIKLLYSRIYFYRSVQWYRQIKSRMILETYAVMISNKFTPRSCTAG